MTFSRAWIPLACVLCFAGTVHAQVNRFPEFDPNLRTAWLNDQQPMRSPMLEDSGSNWSSRPAVRTPTVNTARSQETVKTPDPTPAPRPPTVMQALRRVAGATTAPARCPPAAAAATDAPTFTPMSVD